MCMTDVLVRNNSLSGLRKYEPLINALALHRKIQKKYHVNKAKTKRYQQSVSKSVSRVVS